MCSDAFSPTFLKVLPGVGRLVDAVAEMRAALAGVLAAADPDDVGVLRIDDDAAHREGVDPVGQRLERDAAILRLPHAAERRRDVPDARVLRIDRDVLDAAGVDRRTRCCGIRTPTARRPAAPGRSAHCAHCRGRPLAVKQEASPRAPTRKLTSQTAYASEGIDAPTALQRGRGVAGNSAPEQSTGATSARSAAAARRRRPAFRRSRTCSTSARCNGGVWKTTDYGRTWTPIFDDQPTGSIGAIAVAPSDPNIIYVGSGEGLQRPDLSTGDGIYKSTDAGRDVDAPRPARRPADSADHRRSARPEPAVRRGARPSVRPERGARHLPLDRRRPDLPEGALQGREHRRRRRRLRSRERRHRLRRAVAGAAGPVGERRLQRTGQRRLQVHRRRHHVAADRERACRRSPTTASAASASPSRRRNPRGCSRPSTRARAAACIDRTTRASTGRSSTPTRA